MPSGGQNAINICIPNQGPQRVARPTGLELGNQVNRYMVPSVKQWARKGRVPPGRDCLVPEGHPIIAP